MKTRKKRRDLIFAVFLRLYTVMVHFDYGMNCKPKMLVYWDGLGSLHQCLAS